MTLKEAGEAAVRRDRIESNGITYEKIIMIGYKYTDDGERVPFVRLKDINKLSVTDAHPSQCSVYGQRERK